MGRGGGVASSKDALQRTGGLQAAECVAKDSGLQRVRGTVSDWGALQWASTETASGDCRLLGCTAVSREEIARNWGAARSWV